MISSGSSAAFRARMLNLGIKRIEDALSVFEALSLRDRKLEAPIIIMHRNKGKSVSLGCFQIADEDFAISYLRKKNLDYFFRLHGGDVMLHDENQVGIGIIAPNDEKYKEMHASLMSLLLKRNGIRSFQVTNDYIICFNKILGEVTYLEKESILSWFTVLYLKRSYEEIAGLKFPKEQLIKERVSKLKESCIGLDQVLGKQVSAGRVFEMVKEVLSDELNFRLSAFRLGLADKKCFWKSREMLRKNSISERIRLNYLQLKHSVSLGETFFFSKKLINGFLRVWVKIKDKNVERVSISGSFMFEPPGKLHDFEKMLEGSSLEETSLTEKITEFFINEKIKASFTPFDIVELLCKAPGGK
ncbi:MAG: lipoate--protein ligase family protein [Candidatus Brockarchaeota archaeon]|nr:lipoate--protein ligase family protein [Candidatus Brockarchaeota archaeon]